MFETLSMRVFRFFHTPRKSKYFSSKRHRFNSDEIALTTNLRKNICWLTNKVLVTTILGLISYFTQLRDSKSRQDIKIRSLSIILPNFSTLKKFFNRNKFKFRSYILVCHYSFLLVNFWMNFYLYSKYREREIFVNLYNLL